MADISKIKVGTITYNVKDNNARVITRPLQVGDNLRGKTIRFNTSLGYDELYAIEVENILMGEHFLAPVYVCDNVRLETAQPSTIEVTFFDGGDTMTWLMSEYTFPNDIDYIITDMGESANHSWSNIIGLVVDQQEAYDDTLRIFTKQYTLGDDLTINFAHKNINLFNGLVLNNVTKNTKYILYANGNTSYWIYGTVDSYDSVIDVLLMNSTNAFDQCSVALLNPYFESGDVVEVKYVYGFYYPEFTI